MKVAALLMHNMRTDPCPAWVFRGEGWTPGLKAKVDAMFAKYYEREQTPNFNYWSVFALSDDTIMARRFSWDGLGSYTKGEGMRFYLISLKARMKERISMWIAWRLPKYIVLWCAYRVAANATSGKWANEAVPSVAMMDAITRWAEPNPPVEADEEKAPRRSL